MAIQLRPVPLNVNSTDAGSSLAVNIHPLRADSLCVFVQFRSEVGSVDAFSHFLWGVINNDQLTVNKYNLSVNDEDFPLNFFICLFVISDKKI